TADQPELLQRLLQVFVGRKRPRIAGEVVAAKIALSEVQAASLTLPIEPGVSIEMTRGDVNRAVQEDTRRLIETIDRCCRAAAIKSAAVESVFLTGGSTGIPAVRDRILAHLRDAGRAAGQEDG